MLGSGLFLLGLCFGSFVNALTWRLRKKKDWVNGRSQCVHCGFTLAAIDLIPVLSWLMLRGKCRYCGKKIDDNPLVELSLGLTFLLSYIFWPSPIEGGQLYLFIAWLISSVGLMALLVYDARWTLLPNKLIYPTALIASLGNLGYLATAAGKTDFLISWLSSVLVASGIFLVLYIISKGKWIGYGDVRLGLLTGTLLHSPSISFMMIFLASILGTLFVLPSLIKGKMGFGARLPFGPFLIVATVICLVFGQRLLDWYTSLISI